MLASLTTIESPGKASGSTRLSIVASLLGGLLQVGPIMGMRKLNRASGVGFWRQVVPGLPGLPGIAAVVTNPAWEPATRNVLPALTW